MEDQGLPTDLQSTQPKITYVAPVLPNQRTEDGFSASDFDNEEDEDDQDLFSENDSYEEDSMDQVDHLGWEEGAGDLTKQYNRARQFVEASSSNPNDESSVVPLPASNKLMKYRKRQAANNEASAINTTNTTTSTTTTQKVSSKNIPVHSNKIDSSLATLQAKFASSIDLSPVNFGSTRKGGSEKVLVKDRKDRATTEQVLDSRTRLVLLKMMSSGLISQIDGCVSTGKEANVYHALRGDLQSDNQGHMAAHANLDVSKVPERLAIKVFKTSILIFKDRDRYVTGEFRFRGGYAKSNPRKMVRLWAEKELRNLRRLRAANVPSPEPVQVRNNVLVMGFLGVDQGTWNPSPRLKDAQVPENSVYSLYVEMVTILRTMFWKCKLVHADFSEYNILYHNSHLYVIDVSQSVEHEHPHAFDFLRSDIKNVEDFFKRKGIETLGLRKTFDFIVTPDHKEQTPTAEPDPSTIEEWDESLRIVGEKMQQLYKEMQDEKLKQDQENDKNQQEKEHQQNGGDNSANDYLLTSNSSNKNHKNDDDAVFSKSFLPRSLYELSDAVDRGDTSRYEGEEGKEALKYTGIAHQDEDDDDLNSDIESGSGSDSDSDSGSDNNDNDSDESENSDEEKPSGTRPRQQKKFEDKEEKKERQRAAKEAKREKRKEKMPKAKKKRQIKKTTGKK